MTGRKSQRWPSTAKGALTDEQIKMLNRMTEIFDVFRSSKSVAMDKEIFLSCQINKDEEVISITAMDDRCLDFSGRERFVFSNYWMAMRFFKQMTDGDTHE